MTMTLNQIFNVFTEATSISSSYSPEWNSYAVTVTSSDGSEISFGIARFDFDDSITLAMYDYDANDLISWTSVNLSEDDAFLLETIFNAIAA